MSEPTPVTTTSITADSWSSCRVAGTCRVPTGIQSQYVNTTGAPKCAAASARTTSTATTNAAATEPTPIAVTRGLAFGHASARAPFKTKPASGSTGTSQSRFIP